MQGVVSLLSPNKWKMWCLFTSSATFCLLNCSKESRKKIFRTLTYEIQSENLLQNSSHSSKGETHISQTDKCYKTTLFIKNIGTFGNDNVGYSKLNYNLDTYAWVNCPSVDNYLVTKRCFISTQSAHWMTIPQHPFLLKLYCLFAGCFCE